MSHKQREQICRWFQEEMPWCPRPGGREDKKSVPQLVLMIVLGMTTARVTVLTCQPHGPLSDANSYSKPLLAPPNFP